MRKIQKICKFTSWCGDLSLNVTHNAAQVRSELAKVLASTFLVFTVFQADMELQGFATESPVRLPEFNAFGLGDAHH